MTEKEFLKSYSIEDYDRPSVAADISLFSVLTIDNDNIRKDPDYALGILLIKRASHPYLDKWALPGGFCTDFEDVEETALRKLEEETGVNDAYLKLVGAFGSPNRDPRGWIISNAFMGIIDHRKYTLHAGPEAWEARWFSLSVTQDVSEKNGNTVTNEYKIKLINDDITLSATVEESIRFSGAHISKKYSITESNGLAFDHAKIILQAYLSLKKEAEDYTILFDLLPETFTMAEAQAALEIILGHKVITPNFRRKIKDYVLPTSEFDSKGGHRAAEYYKRNPNMFL